MRWIDYTRQHVNVTALEARAFLIVATAMLLGYGASRLTDMTDLHEHATAATIERLLDSLQRAEKAEPSGSETIASAPGHADGVRTANTAAPPAKAINLNSASVAELDALPGVGPATAQAIAGARKRNKFTSVDDLLDVKGIGEKKLERIRPYVTAP